MRKLLALAFMLAFLAGCHTAPRDSDTVVVLIENSPTNLDPRIGTDAQSQRIDALLFDGLVNQDENFQLSPALAERWEQPDPLTWIFHLRSNVFFHDGRPFTARDVLWTINSLLDGTILAPKAATYAAIQSLSAPDDHTVIFHLKTPDNFLLSNLATRAIGIVPYGSGKDFWQHPIGTGSFRFVRQQIDQDVLIERNPHSWSTQPHLNRVRFAVVPDAITMSLELEKGSADIVVNSLPMDAIPTLAQRSNLQIEKAEGTEIQYLAFNTRDPLLSDVRIRQAIACAMDRQLIIDTLMRGYAKPAQSLLPSHHWAWNGDVPQCNYDPARAARLLDASGHKPGKDGIRFHLTMKTSTDESVRTLSAVLQQQLAKVGIALDLRSNEYATFYSDIVRGAFQIYSLRWIGGNEQPDIFAYAFSSARIPPKGGNRGYYNNPHFDALLNDAAKIEDTSKRRADYAEAQQILARDLPSINLWYRDTLVIHNRRLTHITPSPSGSYSFLQTAELTQ